ncbi:hypothetical protein ALC53_00666 [Atta colombica]|uniref:Uncharacterized protein n=1 Tax=Atta colombica TaxID=520822 RepID=A0A195BVS0_9HYME|nr:hypothetical protein ALC53_00666 [Atta colombica]
MVGEYRRPTIRHDAGKGDFRCEEGMTGVEVSNRASTARRRLKFRGPACGMPKLPSFPDTRQSEVDDFASQQTGRQASRQASRSCVTVAT